MGVKKANIRDLDEILNIINETNKKYYQDIITPGYFRDPVLTNNDLRELFQRMTFFIYEKDNRIVGVAAFEPKSDVLGEMHWVYILSNYQRLGIGTSLVKHIEKEAKKKKFQVLKVPTSEKAYWATNFYTKLGYEEIERKQLPEDKIVIFRKKLKK